MKKRIAIIIAFFATTLAYSQSARVITEILDSDQVTFGQVCYLSAVQQGFVGENASYSEAIEILYQKGQIPVRLYDGSVVPLVNLSYIYAQMWNIKGGLFYRIFHGAPRYAYKQMKADGIFPDYADPGLVISGTEALNIYTACSMKYGNMQLSVE